MTSKQQNFLPELATNSNVKTLVLDLDETLIHSSHKKLNNINFSFFIEKSRKINKFSWELKISVSVRPGACEFLKEMSQYYEIVIFTASKEKYCDNIIQFLDPYQSLISHKLYRQHCIKHQCAIVKDLNKLGRELKNVIIIDNHPDCYLFHQENGFEILPYIDDQNDRELEKLIPFLLYLNKLDDVREVEFQKLKFDKLKQIEIQNCISTKSFESENSYYFFPSLKIKIIYIVEEDENDLTIENQMTLLQKNYVTINKCQVLISSEQLINNKFSQLQQEKPQFIKLQKNCTFETPPNGVERRQSFDAYTISKCQQDKRELLKSYVGIKEKNQLIDRDLNMGQIKLLYQI